MMVTKERITKEDCKRRLYQIYKASIPPVCVLIGCGVLCALLAIPCGNGILTALDNLSEEMDVIGVLILLGSVVGWLALLTPLVLAGAMLALILKRYRQIDKGSFRIVEDKLARIAKDEMVRRGGKWRTENAFYFMHLGRYRVTGWDESAFEYSSEEDRFYLVIFDGKKPQILLVYNMKIYTCPDVDHQRLEER